MKYYYYYEKKSRLMLRCRYVSLKYALSLICVPSFTLLGLVFNSFPSVLHFLVYSTLKVRYPQSLRIYIFYFGLFPQAASRIIIQYFRPEDLAISNLQIIRSSPFLYPAKATLCTEPFSIEFHGLNRFQSSRHRTSL